MLGLCGLLTFPYSSLCSFRWKIFQHVPGMKDDNFQNLTSINTLDGLTFTASSGLIEALEEEAYFLAQWVTTGSSVTLNQG